MWCDVERAFARSISFLADMSFYDMESSGCRCLQRACSRNSWLLVSVRVCGYDIHPGFCKDGVLNAVDEIVYGEVSQKGAMSSSLSFILLAALGVGVELCMGLTTG